MPRLSKPALGACGLITLLLGACSHDKTLVCSRDSVYLEAQTAGALRIPDDLSVPDASESLRIPEAVIAADNDESDNCLSHSPAFRNTE